MEICQRVQLCACTRGNSIPRKQRRLNGFQYPLHPQQIIGWVTLCFTSLTTFLILVPGVGAPYHDPFLYVLLFLYVVHSIFNLVTAVVDPAEEEVRQNKRDVVPEFDRTKHTHVIENGRCHLCNITCTSQKTKHCSICNKCVKNFDHHCKWLNHCIGKRNYALFLSSVVSAIAIALTTIALSAVEIVYYFTDPTKITFGDFVPCINETVPTHVVTTKEVCFLTFATFLAVLAAVISILLMHLCSFHVYISYLGLTTYEYMRNQHDKNGVYMKDGRRCRCRRDEFPMVETGHECECFKHRNNALELASDDPQHFKEYTNGNAKKKSSLCHNQIDPLHDRQQHTRNKPLREIILSPLPLKSKYAPNAPNGEAKDPKKVLSPILEGNNEIVNVAA